MDYNYELSRIIREVKKEACILEASKQEPQQVYNDLIHLFKKKIKKLKELKKHEHSFEEDTYNNSERCSVCGFYKEDNDD
ncbi:MAG: hypothetical protein ACOCQR_01200 [bacterium]